MRLCVMGLLATVAYGAEQAPAEAPPAPAARANVVTINILPAFWGPPAGYLIPQAGYERVLGGSVTTYVTAGLWIKITQYGLPYYLDAFGTARYYFSGLAPTGLYVSAGAGFLVAPTVGSALIGAASFVGYQHVFPNGMTVNGSLGATFGVFTDGGVLPFPIPLAELSLGYAF